MQSARRAGLASFDGRKPSPSWRFSWLRARLFAFLKVWVWVCVIFNIVYFLVAFLGIPALCVCVADAPVSFVLVCSPFLLMFCVENREMALFWAPVIHYSLSSLPSFAEMLSSLLHYHLTLQYGHLCRPSSTVFIWHPPGNSEYLITYNQEELIHISLLFNI